MEIFYSLSFISLLIFVIAFFIKIEKSIVYIFTVIYGYNYFVIPLLIFSMGSENIGSKYFTYNYNSLMGAIFIFFLFYITYLFFVTLLLGKKRYEKVAFIIKDKLLSKYAFVFLLLITIVIAAYKLKLFLQIDRVSIHSGAGRGYLFIFGYIPMLLSLSYLFANKSNLAKKHLMISVIMILPSIVIFATSGQRGGALYPLILSAIVYFSLIGYKRYLLMSLFLIFPIMYIINILSAVFRKIFIYGLLSKSYDIYDLFSSFSVPMAFSHSEILANLIQSSISSFNLVHLYSSFFNWIPRTIFSDKDLTTGPVLAATLLSDVDIRYHSTSLTTGPVIEGYVYFGISGIVLFAFILAVTHVFIERKIKYKNSSYYVIFVWLFAFNIFFDDLGGLINKLVLIMSSILLIEILAILTKRTHRKYT